MSPSGTYIQDDFDKRFVQVIENLVSTRRVHKLFKFQKDLLEAIDCEERHYPEIRKGRRGVPKNDREHIADLLERKYNVNRNYLFFGQKPQYNAPLPGVEDKTEQYITAGQVLELKKRVEQLETLVDQKDEIIQDLKFIIETYRKAGAGSSGV